MSHPQTTGSNGTPATRIPLTGRLTCSVAEACEATGLGRTKIYALIAEGCLESTTVGRRRLIDVASLRQIIEPR
jgi:excisionase family DNA binding protein